MEFRIAPLLLASILLALILFTVNGIYFTNPQKVIGIKLIGVMILIFALSVSTFLSHNFYSKLFKWAFYSVQFLNLLGIVLVIKGFVQQG